VAVKEDKENQAKKILMGEVTKEHQSKAANPLLKEAAEAAGAKAVVAEVRAEAITERFKFSLLHFGYIIQVYFFCTYHLY
jgi:hypothetical protein